MTLDMKKLTRAQAERQLQMLSFDFETSGVRTGRLSAKDGSVVPNVGKPDYEAFMAHANYHVRNKAWKKMGKPLSEDPVAAKSFLDSIHAKLTKQEWAERFPINAGELAALEAATTEEDWNKVCDDIKSRRMHQYPIDWWPKMKESGLLDRKQAEFRSNKPTEVPPATEGSAS